MQKKELTKLILFIFFFFWSLVEIENTEFEIKKQTNSIHIDEKRWISLCCFQIFAPGLDALVQFP